MEALRGLRGIDLVSAATFIASTGDLSRFESPRLLMGYLGLVPSEHSSGGTIRRTKPNAGPPRPRPFARPFAEAIAFVIGTAIGLQTGRASADYIHLYHGNAALLAESLEVVQRAAAVILSALETPAAEIAAETESDTGPALAKAS